MPPNGPAIKGGCVARRPSWWREVARVRVQIKGSGEHGALFANPGAMLIELRRNRGAMSLSNVELVPIDKAAK